MMTDRPTLGVAMIGHGFMGRAHSQGWRVAPRFFDSGIDPTMTLLVGQDADRAADAARRWGWAESDTDWRRAIARDDIDIVDIVTPGDSHAEIAIAALTAGKHVLCEKPLANSIAEARAMSDAADVASHGGVIAMLGHTYRRVPAAVLARDLVASGRIGEIYQVRSRYLQDWLADPEAPRVWRLQRELAGSGALGDIGAHIIDLSEFICGRKMVSVSGTLETITTERPLPGGDGRGAVTVDDLALFTARFAPDGGRQVLGTFEATRMATGRRNALRVEVSGSLGAVAFDLEDLNTLEFYDATADPGVQGFTKILVTQPMHPYIEAWWPPGHVLGFEHAFAHQAADFVAAIVSGAPPSPSFADGLHIQRVLDAVEASSSAGSAWTAVDPAPGA